MNEIAIQVDRVEATMGDRLRTRLLRALAQLTSAARSIAAPIDVDGRLFQPGGPPVWLLRRSSFDLRISRTRFDAEVWHDVEIDLRSGPDELYGYYPFCAFVYAGDELVAVAEFEGPQQRQTVSVRLRAGRVTTMSIVSELSSRTETDERELGILLVDVRLGRVVARPEPRFEHIGIDQDHFSQQLFPLVTEIVRPIFVIGAYRSGTSILTWALGQHPNIWPLDETRWLQLLGQGASAGYVLANGASRSYFKTYDISFEEYMAQIGQSVDGFMKTTSLRRWQRTSLGRLALKEGKEGKFIKTFQLARSAFNPKRRWIDGTPENAACVQLLRWLFPAARFILAVRNPLDVIASMMFFDRAGGKVTTPEEAAEMWRQMTMGGLLAYRAYGPSCVRIVRYEDLVGDPLRALTELFDFLGEPRFARAAESYGKRINSSQIDPHERVRVREQIEKFTEREELLDLYGEAFACTRRPWRHDPDALSALDDETRELTRRIAEQIGFSNA